MDFDLNEEEAMFQRTVRDFAQREIAPQAARIDDAEEFPFENVRRMGELGLMGLTIPTEYGGSGGSSLSYAIAVEEVSHACAATGVILAAHLSLACAPIYTFGNEEQRHRYLPAMASGEKIGALGYTEPNAGSDAAAIETTAVRKGVIYILNGNKNFVTNGGIAETMVICATLDRSQGWRGITAFVVEKGTPGLSAGRTLRKLGIRGASTTELVLQDCAIPIANRLGEEGQGFKIVMQTIDGGRIGIAAQGLGIAQACLDASLRYAKERRQFGQPIATFQAIQWMLADMAVGIEAARLLTYRAARLKDQGRPFSKEAAMAKLQASEVAMASAVKAVQIHGGYGYVKDFPVERYFRDAKITEIYEGTSEIQRLVIARSLLEA